MKSVGIESLESRVLFSHAAIDAGDSAATATDIGSFARNHSVSLKQTVGGDDKDDYFKFVISGATDKAVTLKLSQPKHGGVRYDLRSVGNALNDFGSRKTYVLGPGTYVIDVTGGAATSKYSLNVGSSSAPRTAPITKSTPYLSDILRDPGVLRFPVDDPAMLQANTNIATLQYTNGLIASEPQLGAGNSLLNINDTITAQTETTAASPLNLGGGVLNLANGNNSGSTSNLNLTQGVGIVSITGIGSVSTQPESSASSGTLNINTNNTTGGASTIVVGNYGGTFHWGSGTTLVVSSPTADLAAMGIDLATLSLPQDSKIVLDQPTADQLAAIQSNPNLHMTQNDDGSCTITAAPPADNTTTQAASDSGATGTSDSSNSNPNTSTSANS